MNSQSNLFIINNKIIFQSIVIATLLHVSLIPISQLIKLEELDEDEPKIILELINEVEQEIQPLKNEIEAPIIEKPEEISPPTLIDPPNEIKLLPIDNSVQNISNPLEIDIPTDLKPINLNKIDVPKIIKNNTTEVLIKELPKVNVITPLSINKNIKPVKPNNISIIKDPQSPNKFAIEQSQTKLQNIINKPLKTNAISNISDPTKVNNLLDKQSPPQLQNAINKPIKKEAPTIQKKELTEDEIKQLDNYKIKIRKSIQAVAIRNYPRKAINRKLQGIVNIIFELNEDGSLINVRSGPNTKADEVLINAAIKILEESAPFDKIPFSKQKNEFSININYILR